MTSEFTRSTEAYVRLTSTNHEAVGLNRIFTHREQESVLLPAALAAELGKEDQQPDGIYGLRQTRNFEEALYVHAHNEYDQSDKLVADLITASPLSTDGDPLLFPFLLLEAKSGKASDDWHSIKLQTAFPIQACLKVQRDLQTKTARGYDWENEPLVWFFMNKGEDWQLCAAYTSTKPGPEETKDADDYVRLPTICFPQTSRAAFVLMESKPAYSFSSISSIGGADPLQQKMGLCSYFLSLTSFLTGHETITGRIYLPQFELYPGDLTERQPYFLTVI